MTSAEQIEKFMEPRSVAIIGASRYTGEEAFNIVENLISYGYGGRIYPVNPNAREIMGVASYASIGDIEDKIDLAVINLPRRSVLDAFKQCLGRGTAAIVIVTQGFADADDTGKELQRELIELSRTGQARMLGPNTLGTANAFARFSSSFVRLNMARIPVGFIGQTGSLITCPQYGLIGKGIDLGNAGDIDFADALAYFEQDDDTRVVAMHIEGLPDGRRFLDAASRVARAKPVIALKTGKSQQAARAAQSHTGLMVGNDRVWEAALRQHGIIRAGDIDELADLARAFSLLPLTPVRKLGIITYSGGLGIIAIDACSRFGVSMSELSATTMQRFREMSPEWHEAGNPVDIWPAISISGNAPSRALQAGAEALLSDPEVDAAIVIWAAQTPQTCSALCEVLPEMASSHPGKLLVCCVHGHYAEEAKRRLEATGRVLATFSPERAVRAVAAVSQYSAFRDGL